METVQPSIFDSIVLDDNARFVLTTLRQAASSELPDLTPPEWQK